MGVLYRKELRSLLPWLVLVVTLELGAQLMNLLETPPDELVWAVSTPIFSGGNATGRNFMLLVSSLVFAYSGLAREHDDRTLMFLLSLPVSRKQIFLAKTLAAASVLSAVVLGEETLRYVVQLPNSTSFDGTTFRWQWALVSAGSGVALACIFLGYSLFLSIFRRFGLLVGMLALVAVQWAVQGHPELRRWNPLDLQRMEFEGTRAVVPYRALFGHFALSLCLAGVAGFVWLGSSGRWTSMLSRWVSVSSTKWLFGLCVAITLGFTVWTVSNQEEASTASFGRVLELESPEVKLQTRRYEFRYPAVLRSRVDELARSADDLHDRIAHELGSAESNQRVVVNLLRSSPTHAGSASWDTIRMDPAHASDERGLLRTLAHETTHVVALRASDRRTTTHHDAVRFFDEGLAEQLALELLPDDGYLGARSLEAVLAVTRSSLEFEDLTHFPRFSERFGEPAVYSPALFWVKALQLGCGADAPRRVLHVLARGHTPPEADGVALWQHLLQAMRCDLSRVNALWGERIRQGASELRDEVARVPTIVGGAPSVVDEEIVLSAAIEGKPLIGAVYLALVRTRGADVVVGGSNAASITTVQGDLEPNGSLRFVLPYLYEAGDSIEYQFAVSWVWQGWPVQHAAEWQKTVLPN